MKRSTDQNLLPFQTGDHVLVVGLGKSGIAAARFLLGLGIRVSVSEGGRAVAPASEAVSWLQERGVYCELGGHSPELFSSVDAIVVSPGVPLDIPALRVARRAGVPIIGELALASSYLKTPVIAITGTNGKSTVTTLIGELLQAAGMKVFVGGNLGVPLCEYLAGPQDAQWAVLELSSFQLDSAGDFAPAIGLLLNISPDHLDRYPDYAAYGAAKWRLFAHQRPGDYALLNGDDPQTMALWRRQPPRSQVLFFNGRAGEACSAAVAECLATGGSRPTADQLVTAGAVGQSGPEPVAPWSCGAAENGPLLLRLPGTAPEAQPEQYDLAGTVLAAEPNRQNAKAAILAARLAGAAPAAIARGLAAFAPLPHRLALVATVAGVDFYDDSKATNIGAVISALAGMRRPVVLIAGGLDKGGDYRLLLPAFRDKVKALVLIGSAREKMAAALREAVTIEEAADLPAAVQAAFALAAAGDAVLLSPACASFDMFSGYGQRGKVFRQAVAELQQNVAGGGGRAAHGCPVMMEAMVT